jgi:hypothetical protein
MPITGLTNYLMVLATPWLSTRAKSQPSQAHYRPRFYPTAATPDGASALQLAAGQETHADFRLEDAEMPALELKLSPSPPRDTALLRQLRAPGIGGNHCIQHPEYRNGSQHSLRGVPHGRVCSGRK